MKRDPLCNMEVDEETGLTAECDGEIHYFCSEGCWDRFLREKACKLPREGAKAAMAAKQYLLDLRTNVN